MRASAAEQDLIDQIEDLNQAGCERIFGDKAIGTKSNRSGFRQGLDYMREGDLLAE